MYSNALILLLIGFTRVASDMSAKEQKRHPNFYLLPQAPYCSTKMSFPSRGGSKRGSYSARIVGGSSADYGEYPWAVRLGTAVMKCPDIIDYLLCGGTLITANHVLTTAHCTVLKGKWKHKKCPDGTKSTWVLCFVTLGALDLRKDGVKCDGSECSERSQTINLKQIIKHLDYSREHFKNNIALLVLKTQANINELVNPICLPMGSLMEKSYVGSTAEVIGWGRTGRSKSSKSDKLKTLEILIVDPKECAAIFGALGDYHLHHGETLCAGGEKGEGSCHGDSGGPLMVEESQSGINSRKYLVGLVAFGKPSCAKEGQPSYYTKVTHHMKWILDNLADIDESDSESDASISECKNGDVEDI